MLETARLRLRNWRESDLDDLVSMNQDALVMRHVPAKLDREQSEAMLSGMREHYEQHRFGFCAVELRETSEFIGIIGLGIPSWEAHFTPCIEVGWRLRPTHWGHGYATEGARACLDVAFDRGYEEVVAMTTPGNSASLAVMQRLGMSRDPRDDFDHPRIPEGNPLRRHVLCRIAAGTRVVHSGA